MADQHAAIRFIYFDLGNVILHFDRSVAYRQLAEASGVSEDQVREVLESGELQVHYESGEISSQGFCDRFCEAIDKQISQKTLLEAGSSIFSPNVPLIPVITQLAAANHRLGILSNTCEAHWDYCSDGRYGILKNAFDIHILSFRVHSMKPDVKIYEVAVAQAGVSPQEVFFVDDMPENVEAAQQYGIDAVLYTTVPQLVSDLRQRGVRFNY